MSLKSVRKPRSKSVLTLLVTAALAVGLGLAPERAAARLFDPQLLDAARVERMPEDAKLSYEKALAAMDKILFERALEHLQTAIEQDPDNMHLRYVAVQTATYLGDTRSGAESIRYYTVAAHNLRVMADSPRLNLREQRRAGEALDYVVSLQQSVVERDQQRKAAGMEIAKQYMQELREGAKKDGEEEASEEVQRSRVEELRRQLDGGEGEAPAGVQGLTPPAAVGAPGGQ